MSLNRSKLLNRIWLSLEVGTEVVFELEEEVGSVCGFAESVGVGDKTVKEEKVKV